MFLATFLIIFYLAPSSFAFLINSGYYVGKGVAQSITGVGFKPDLVIIKADTVTGRAVWCSSAMSSGSTAYFEYAVPNETGGFINSLDSDGFSVGTNAAVNSANVRYVWIAFGGSGGSDFKVGSYEGNGNDDYNITGIGFQPDLVWVKRNGNSLGVWYSSSMPSDNSQYFSATAPAANLIQALLTNGFQVGSDPTVNASGNTYFYVAFKAGANMAVGNYSGDGTDNRSITIASGFKPDFMFIKQSAATNPACLRSNQSYGDESQNFTAAANVTDRIQSFEANGFQVGANAQVNASGSTYYYAAFKGIPAPSPSGVFKMVSGSYNGGPGTSQSITSVGFKPDLVIIKSDTAAGSAVFTSTCLAPDSTSYLAVATANFNQGIISLDNNGFSVGNSANVNSSGVTYRWIAFGNSGSTNFKVGAYTGTGADNRSITGLGFAPDFVVIKSTGANLCVFRTTSMTGDTTAYFSATADTSDRIQALESDGFQIGTNAEVNSAGVLYTYFAFKNTSGQFVESSYSGNGLDNRSITGLGFRPGLVWIKQTGAVGGVHRGANLSGDNTQYFTATANLNDAIQALEANGFQVGQNSTVNANGVTYRYAAWKTTSTKVAFTTQPSNATAGSVIAPAVQVAVQDAYGNTDTTDNSSQITISLGNNPGGGTLSGTLTKTVSSGIATFDDLKIDKAGTGYTLVATSSEITPTTSEAFNITPAAANKLGFYVQPSQTAAGSTISPAVKVSVQDQFGNIITSDNSTSITLSIQNNPSGGNLFGTKTKTVASGIATFDDLSIDKVATGYTLLATAEGLTLATSDAFSITPATAYKLKFVVQPTTTEARVIITPSIKVEVVDIWENRVTSDNATQITIAFQNNPSGATLLGTKTKTVSAGLATFDNLSVDFIGSGYTLVASAPYLQPATSESFDVTAETIAPYLISFTPSGEGVSVEAKIRLYFSEAMDQTSVEFAFSLTAVRNNLGNSINFPVSGTFSWVSPEVVEFSPSSLLEYNYTYQVAISREAKDSVGNHLANDLSFIFTTVSSSDALNSFVGEDGRTRLTLPEEAVGTNYYARISISPESYPIKSDPSKISAADTKVEAEKNKFKFRIPGSAREFVLYSASGERITSLKSSATITLPYSDTNGDGYVDGTNARVDALRICRLDENNNLWVIYPESILDSSAKTISTYVRGLSTFALMALPAATLSQAYAFPNPFKPSLGHKTITFTNLASECTIKIYTLAGDLVKTLVENDGNREYVWDVKNEAGENLASGLYFYVIKSADDTKTGKLVIIR